MITFFAVTCMFLLTYWVYCRMTHKSLGKRPHSFNKMLDNFLIVICSVLEFITNRINECSEKKKIKKMKEKETHWYDY